MWKYDLTGDVYRTKLGALLGAQWDQAKYQWRWGEHALTLFGLYMTPFILHEYRDRISEVEL